MQIDLPPEELKRLEQMAAAAGFEDVKRFIQQHLAALAHHPPGDDLPLLSSAELQISLETCDRSMTELDTGTGLSVADAHERCIKALLDHTS